MSWARLDDAYYRHPKVQAAGAYGMCLDIAGICYAADHATDGFIPDVALPTLLAFANRTQHKEAAAQLVKVGRWLRDEDRGGWWVHDFLDYNPSAADRSKASQAAKQRAAASRERRSGARGVQRTRDELAAQRNRTPLRPVHDSRTPTPKDRITSGSSSPSGGARSGPPPQSPPVATPSPSPSGDASATEHPKRCRHRNDPTTCGICSDAATAPPPRADLERILRRPPDQPTPTLPKEATHDP
jgi:hypothetical protein